MLLRFILMIGLCLVQCFQHSLLITRLTIRQSHFKMTKADSTVKRIREQVVKSVTIPVTKRGYAFRRGPGEYSEHDKFLGVTNPDIRIIAKDNSGLSLPDLQFLMESAYNEERFLALVILAEQYKKGDAVVRESVYNFYMANLKHVNNWNLVDCSAYLILGPHLENRDRDSLVTLANSAVLWERRVAIVSTFHFIRLGDLDWTFILARQLLQDEHDLMHKAVGWMLREAGKRDVSRLVAFLDEYAAVMPRTMLRYSLEKLTNAQKRHYMGLQRAAK